MLCGTPLNESQRHSHTKNRCVIAKGGEDELVRKAKSKDPHDQSLEKYFIDGLR